MHLSSSGQSFTSIMASGDFGEDSVRMALDIFEAMGLIVPITLKHPKTGEPMAFYRRSAR